MYYQRFNKYGIMDINIIQNKSYSIIIFLTTR